MLILGKRKSSLSGCSANMASSLTVSLERIFLKNFTAATMLDRRFDGLFLLEIIRTKEAPVMLAFLCSIYTKRLQHKLQPSDDIISSRSDYFLKKS